MSERVDEAVLRMRIAGRYRGGRGYPVNLAEQQADKRTGGRLEGWRVGAAEATVDA